MWRGRWDNSIQQIPQVIHGVEDFKRSRVTSEQEVSVVDILKTVTFEEAVDMLLGTAAVLYLMIGLVLAFEV